MNPSIIVQEWVQAMGHVTRLTYASQLVESTDAAEATAAMDMVEAWLVSLAEIVTRYPLRFQVVGAMLQANSVFNDSEFEVYNREIKQARDWGDFIVPDITVLAGLITAHHRRLLMATPGEKAAAHDFFALHKFDTPSQSFTYLRAGGDLRSITLGPRDLLAAAIQPYVSTTGRQHVESLAAELLAVGAQFPGDGDVTE